MRGWGDRGELGPPKTSMVAKLRPTSHRRICETEHHAVIRCVASNLLGRGGAYDACARDLDAIRKLPRSEDPHAREVLEVGWVRIWKHFQLPLEQLVATAKVQATFRMIPWKPQSCSEVSFSMTAVELYTSVEYENHSFC